MKTILITGTPGTGKSTLIHLLEDKLTGLGKKVSVINANDLIKTKKLYEEYDKNFDSFIIDERKVRKHLKTHIPTLKADICLLETHTVSAVPSEYIGRVIVLICRTEVLYDRLVAREYPKIKIDENIECEIMQVVLEEVHDKFRSSKIIELNSNTSEDLHNNVEKLVKEII